MAKDHVARATRLAGLIGALAFTLLAARPLPAAQPLAVGAKAVGNCKFHTATATLNFGTLDPAAARDATATAALTFKCTKSAAWSVTDDGGLNGAAGATRMRHTVLAAFIPYRLTYANATGTSQGANVTETLTVNGLIRGADFATVPSGTYADTVTLSISP